MDQVICNKQFNFDDITGKSIKVFGTKSIPYFKANDVADILEYADTARAIYQHVTSKNKKNLKEIREILNPGATCTLPKLKGNEGATMYITEAGLYELILASKMKKAKIFQMWICEDVLPKIRATGRYEIAKYANQDLKTHLLKIEKNNIIEENIIPESENLNFKKSESENSESENSEIEKLRKSELDKLNLVKLEKSTKVNKIKKEKYITTIDEKLFPQLQNLKLSTPKEFIIISTNDLQKKYNLYKINCCKKIVQHKNCTILNSYEIENGKQIENYLHAALKTFAYGDEKDIFQIDYKVLTDLVQNICSTNNTHVVVLAQSIPFVATTGKILTWFYKNYKYTADPDKFIYVNFVYEAYAKLHDVEQDEFIEQMMQDTNFAKYYCSINNTCDYFVKN